MENEQKTCKKKSKIKVREFFYSLKTKRRAKECFFGIHLLKIKKLNKPVVVIAIVFFVICFIFTSIEEFQKNKTQSKKVEESNEYAKKIIGKIDDEIEKNNEMISGRPKMTKKQLMLEQINSQQISLKLRLSQIKKPLKDSENDFETAISNSDGKKAKEIKELQERLIKEVNDILEELEKLREKEQLLN